MQTQNKSGGERPTGNRSNSRVLEQARIPIDQLRAEFRGQVFTPDEDGYEEARTLFYGGFNQRPTVIARPVNAAGVSEIVSLARDNGIELAVRSGGHSLAGHSLSDGGIVLDLHNLKSLQIDVERRTAWAEAGLTAGEYVTAAGAYGLTTGFGDTGSVGIGGITLGGGIGLLVRKYGLTIDDLLAAEVVTADGQILQVDKDNHPDLFWAIRGGGGNFGVATRFQFRLHPLDTIMGGMLILPATPEIIASFISLAEAASEDLSTIANIMPAPPMPFIPPESRGQLILLAIMVYAGDIDAGKRALKPFKTLTTPIADMLKPVRYPEMFPPEQPGFHPTAAGHTMFVNAIDQGASETIVGYLQSSDAAMRAAQLRVLGGAMERVPASDTAFAHRHARIMVNLGAFYNSPEEQAGRKAWISDFAAALDQGVYGAYVNFMDEGGEEQARAAYPGPTWKRLATIKAQYDPENLFRRNHNIPPAVNSPEYGSKYKV